MNTPEKLQHAISWLKEMAAWFAAQKLHSDAVRCRHEADRLTALAAQLDGKELVDRKLYEEMVACWNERAASIQRNEQAALQRRLLREEG